VITYYKILRSVKPYKIYKGIKVNLKQICFFFRLQLRVVAFDTSIPRLRATAEVFITVTRNLYEPIFDPQEYRVTISEDTPVGQFIQKLTVNDNDGVSEANIGYLDH